MKLVVAVIKPFKLEEVKAALEGVGVQGLTVTDARGFGHGQALDADALQRRLHLFQLERFDDRDDQLHQPRSPWGTRTVEGARSGGAAAEPVPTWADPTPSAKA